MKDNLYTWFAAVGGDIANLPATIIEKSVKKESSFKGRAKEIKKDFNHKF